MKGRLRSMVSIIIPVFNSINTLKKCVESILVQTYQEYEIILVDDGSNDGCEILCDAYNQAYRNITVVHQYNTGPAAAREVGIRNSNGEFIMFVDSDDWIDINLLKIFVEHQIESQADMICCNFINIYKNGKQKMIHKIKKEMIVCNSIVESLREIYTSRNLITGPVMKLIRRSLFEGIDFNKNVIIGEDYSMVIQIVKRCKKIIILNKVLYYRFVGEHNISRSGYTEMHKDALPNYMKIRYQIIEEYGELTKYVMGYHLEYEMAVLTAMCRNDNYDKRIIFMLKNDLRKNITYILLDNNVSVIMKISAILIAYATPLFIIIFRVLHKMVGR